MPPNTAVAEAGFRWRDQFSWSWGTTTVVLLVAIFALRSVRCKVMV
jgi:hypothetical protein